MRDQPKHFLGYLRKALHKNYGTVAREHLPSRWIDLIHELNDREKDQEYRRRADAMAGPRKDKSMN